MFVNERAIEARVRIRQRQNRILEEGFLKVHATGHPADSRCPICSGNQIIEVGSPQLSRQAAAYVTTDYRVVRCRTCRFYFVAPQISLGEDDWEKLYGEEYFEEMTPWWAEKRNQDRKRQLDWLRESSGDSLGKFLDVGCGEGQMLVEASARGWSAYGIDISDNRMDAAKVEDIHFRKGNIFDASFPNEFFDSVYINSVLEHVVDPMDLLREIKRILRVRGLLFLGVPNEDCLYNDVRQVIFRLVGRGNVSSRLCPFKSPYHVSGFTERSLATALDEIGFDVVRFRNLAGEHEWRKHRILTRPFLIHFLLLPVHLLAVPVRKRLYFEIVGRKGDRERGKTNAGYNHSEYRG